MPPAKGSKDLVLFSLGAESQNLLGVFKIVWVIALPKTIILWCNQALGSCGGISVPLQTQAG